MRRALSFGAESALAAAAPAMLVRALLALVVGCVALVVACTDDDTTADIPPQLQEQQAAVEAEQEHSSERGEAAPASAAAETTHETQSNETQDSAEPADSETSEKPETKSADAAAAQSASDNPSAESGDQTATEQTAAVESEPEPSVAQAQSQQAPVEAETQTEPEPAQQAQDADNNVQDKAEETHVAQAPVTDADVDPEEEPTSPVVATPVASNDNVGGSSSMTENQPGGQIPLDSTQEKGSGQTVGVSVSSGTTYTWQDGEYTRTVSHLADPTVDAGAGAASDIGPREAAGTQSDSNPVFQSDTGQTMTLPGGVLLVLDPEWDQARSDKFFKDNNVDRNLVQERTFTTNAYLIETEPGFPSLNLANELAGQEGVVISSPNWQTEVETQ